MLNPKDALLAPRNTIFVTATILYFCHRRGEAD
jgi:hypothetical protein